MGCRIGIPRIAQPIGILASIGVVIPKNAEYKGRRVRTFPVHPSVVLAGAGAFLVATGRFKTTCIVSNVLLSYTEAHVMQINFMTMAYFDSLAIQMGWQTLPTL